MLASTAGKDALALPHPAHATEEEARQGCRSILGAFLPSKFFQIGQTRVGWLFKFRRNGLFVTCLAWNMESNI